MNHGAVQRQDYLNVAIWEFVYNHAEGWVCVEALMESRRQAERNEKLLAAKDSEIRALREQVELQRG